MLSTDFISAVENNDLLPNAMAALLLVEQDEDTQGIPVHYFTSKHGEYFRVYELDDGYVAISSHAYLISDTDSFLNLRS